MPSIDERRRAAPPGPTNLHLKKELSQLRKAARGSLKDPGTSSSASAKSLTTGNGNDSPPSQLPLRFNDYESDPDPKQAFLCNWIDRKKPGIRDAVVVDNGDGDDDDDVRDDVSSYNNADSSTSVSVAGGGNDYRSDGCLSSVYGGSSILKCNGSSVAPSIRRTIRKKAKRVNYSSAGSRDRMQMLLSRYTKSASVMDGSSFGDDTDEYCNSPLLTRIEGYRGNKKSSSSYYKKEDIVESWDATTISVNDADHDVVDDDEDDDVDGLLDSSGQQKGCGIPCYWSRMSTPKSRGSLRNGRNSPLESEDERFANFGELDLEALSCRNEVNDEHVRSLSHKYRPVFFEELIGQNIVVKALKNAVLKARVSSLYLFHGPHGVGKISTARIFASALNCLTTEETKPCGVCRECSDSISGKSRHLLEVSGSNERGIERVERIFKQISTVYFEKYKVFVVNECHLLPSRAWLSFHRILEKPLPRVVFILVSSDIDSVPRAVLSRCHKHFFNKISNGEIVARLRKVSGEERLEVEPGALDLVASSADGSMRDAETVLDQLSVLGKRITKSLVNELIGVVSDEKLMELLELAMSSNATETVIRARELMDSGVDPTVLMSKLVSLIMDVIAGTRPSLDAKGNHSFRLTERELDGLKHALTVLSEAEKRLRFSCERSTWFTASLLQLGSVPSPDRKTRSISSQRKSFNSAEEAKRFSSEKKQVSMTHDVGCFDSTSKDSEMMTDIWMECIEKCHSQTLRQLLLSFGKLVLLSETEGGFVAHIAFEDSNIKTRAEGFLSSITNSFEIVFRCNVEVKLLPMQDSSKLARGNLPEPLESTEANGELDLPLRRLESIIHEEKLESAWLQAMDRNTPVSLSPSRPQRNQVHLHKSEPADYASNQLQLHQNRTYELNREIKELKINGVGNHTDKIVRRTESCPISPSLLHNDSMGYESGSGAGACGAMLCWNNRRGKSKRRGAAHEGKSGRFSWFGECAKGRHTDNSLIL